MGSAPRETHPQASQLSASLENFLTRESITREASLFPEAGLAHTRHYAVFFSDAKALSTDIATGGEMSPAKLGEHLEAKHEAALELFRLPDSPIFRSVLVRMADEREAPLPPQGKNTEYSDGKRANLTFVFLHPDNRIADVKNTGVDDLRHIAVYGAIGHGLVRKELDTSTQVRFLSNGVADYATWMIHGVDPHDVMGQHLVDNARNAFGKTRRNISGDISKKQASEVCLQPHNTISISGTFFLHRESGTGQEKPEELADFYRGASFIKYLVDVYGMETFKTWAKNVDADNFYSSLTKMTGKSVGELQQEWKETVLQDEHIADNPLILAGEKTAGLSPEQSERERQEREEIQEVYRRFADPDVYNDLSKQLARNNRRRKAGTIGTGALIAATIASLAVPVARERIDDIRVQLQQRLEGYERNFERTHILGTRAGKFNENGWRARYSQDAGSYQQIPGKATLLRDEDTIDLKRTTDQPNESGFAKCSGNTGIRVFTFTRTDGQKTVRLDPNGDTGFSNILRFFGRSAINDDDDRLLRIHAKPQIPNPKIVWLQNTSKDTCPVRIELSKSKKPGYILVAPVRRVG